MTTAVSEIERNTLEAVASELAVALDELSRWMRVPNRHNAERMGYRALHMSGGSSAVAAQIQLNAHNILMSARYLGLLREEA